MAVAAGAAGSVQMTPHMLQAATIEKLAANLIVLQEKHAADQRALSAGPPRTTAEAAAAGAASGSVAGRGAFNMITPGAVEDGIAPVQNWSRGGREGTMGSSPWRR